MMLSIELLPAPLGLMIDEISPRLTSKLTPVIARTPPKRRWMLSTARKASSSAASEPCLRFCVAPNETSRSRRLRSPMAHPRDRCASFERARLRSRGPGESALAGDIDDLQIGLHDAAAPVLELDLGLDVLRRPSLVE